MGGECYNKRDWWSVAKLKNVWCFVCRKFCLLIKNFGKNSALQICPIVQQICKKIWQKT